MCQNFFFGLFIAHHEDGEKTSREIKLTGQEGKDIIYWVLSNFISNNKHFFFGEQKFAEEAKEAQLRGDDEEDFQLFLREKLWVWLYSKYKSI